MGLLVGRQLSGVVCVHHLALIFYQHKNGFGILLIFRVQRAKRKRIWVSGYKNGGGDTPAFLMK